MTFNGRIHSNGNIYALRNMRFLNRVSMAGEFVREAQRAAAKRIYRAVLITSGFEVNGVNVKSTKGSVHAGERQHVGGPNLPGTVDGQRGFYPESPNGVPNPNWETESVKPANGTANQFRRTGFDQHDRRERIENAAGTWQEIRRPKLSNARCRPIRKFFRLRVITANRKSEF